MKIPIKQIQIGSYIFPEGKNPFAFDAQPKKTMTEIANQIKDGIEELANKHKVLIRGIQSGKHNQDRVRLIKKIIQEGSDGYSEKLNGRGVLFAATYDGIQTVEFVLSGFHEFKPKCEERPQYPVDVWMIFDESAFKNIEYIHPRHHTKANDKWQVIDNAYHGLLAVIVLN